MNESTHPHETTATFGNLDRRVVLRASAWSVPVIAVASSAPLAAATGGTMALFSSSWASSTKYLTLTLLLVPDPVGTPTITVTSDDTTVVPVSTTVISGGTVQVVVALPSASGGDSVVLDIASTGYSPLATTVVLPAPGSLDTTFDPGAGLNNNGRALALQPDGKIIVTGAFTAVDGTARGRIARLNADGSLDTTFSSGTGLSALGRAAAVLSDGKVVVTGDFTPIIGPSGVNRNFLARLNANGSLDTTFSLNLNYIGLGLAVQSDGKVVVVGDFGNVAGVSRSRVARLNTDATLDGGFNPGLNDTGVAVAVQTDGKILVAGIFTFGAGTYRNRVLRMNADGTIDTTFNPGIAPNPVSGLNNTGQALALQADGKIIVTGDFTTVDNVSRNRIARLNTNGSLDTTFDPGVGLNGTGYAVAVQADGKIVVAGDFTTVNGVARDNIARLNTDGSLDTTFNPGLNGSGRALVLQPDGRILVTGFFTTADGTARSHIARLHG
ncbi:MAG TPA: hypothetical protein PKE40_08680 [Arachnia sp.]|nr:hypothetical protein [Arachnia sp.]HMT86412.1 hypothetical protein [Arachnia sp.]